MKCKSGSVQMLGFTRKEAMVLTGRTSSQIVYLERRKLIIPFRYGVGDRSPTVIFSWEQLVGIIAAQDLKDAGVSLQTIRKILELLAKNECGPELRNKRLAAINDEVFWIDQDWSDFSANIPKTLKPFKSSEVRSYVFVTTPEYCHYINRIWDAAKNSDLINFSSFRERARVNLD